MKIIRQLLSGRYALVDESCIFPMRSLSLATAGADIKSPFSFYEILSEANAIVSRCVVGNKRPITKPSDKTGMLLFILICCVSVPLLSYFVYKVIDSVAGLL